MIPALLSRKVRACSHHPLRSRHREHRVNLFVVCRETTTNKKQTASHSLFVVAGHRPELFIENRYLPILNKNIPLCACEAGGELYLDKNPFRVKFKPAFLRVVIEFFVGAAFIILKDLAERFYYSTFNSQQSTFFTGRF